jgi:hypothetical protein
MNSQVRKLLICMVLSVVFMSVDIAVTVSYQFKIEGANPFWMVCEKIRGAPDLGIPSQIFRQLDSTLVSFVFVSETHSRCKPQAKSGHRHDCSRVWFGAAGL